MPRYHLRKIHVSKTGLAQSTADSHLLLKMLAPQTVGYLRLHLLPSHPGVPAGLDADMLISCECQKRALTVNPSYGRLSV